ncbi:MAG: hypothetical protein J7L91_00875, partial [Candidatus Korarchaeota archaeon]|nr:hypothetical protein [Candidatus Korarchaeota archaeon]
IKKAVEELPDPKVTFVEVGGIKIEALLLGGEPEAVIILSRDEKQNRPERLREMGLKVRSIVI